MECEIEGYGCVDKWMGEHLHVNNIANGQKGWVQFINWTVLSFRFCF